jgi:hypothetical protein
LHAAIPSHPTQTQEVKTMGMTEKVFEAIKTLPDQDAAEVLDFVEFLKARQEKGGLRHWGSPPRRTIGASLNVSRGRGQASSTGKNAMTVRVFADTNTPFYALDVDPEKRGKALAPLFTPA